MHERLHVVGAKTNGLEVRAVLLDTSEDIVEAGRVSVGSTHISEPWIMNRVIISLQSPGTVKVWVSPGGS